jgi:hypothetical protein
MISIKIGTQTETNMLKSKITKAEVQTKISRWPPPPILRFKCVLSNGQLPPDFDENWFNGL